MGTGVVDHLHAYHVHTLIRSAVLSQDGMAAAWMDCARSAWAHILCAGTGVAHAFWPLLPGVVAPLQPLPSLLLC